MGNTYQYDITSFHIYYSEHLIKYPLQYNFKHRIMLPSFTKNIRKVLPKHKSNFFHLITCVTLKKKFVTAFIAGGFLVWNHPVVVLLTVSLSLCQHEDKGKRKRNLWIGMVD